MQDMEEVKMKKSVVHKSISEKIYSTEYMDINVS
jgi:hypothetical protein